MNKKVAFITGVTGQDGSYLADYLLQLGYVVYGLVRRNSTPNYNNIQHLLNNKDFKIVHGDLTDQNSITRIIANTHIDQFYNLGAQSFVAQSFNTPEYTSDVNALGTLRCLEAIRLVNKPIKFYNACTSQMFGKMVQNPANQNTPFYPRSPYGVAKLYSYWITKNYRQTYNMFTCNGILFNHQSARRGQQFVTQKIIRGICDIIEGKSKTIALGNLNAKRDWGAAQEYIKAMHLMLQQDNPDDYVVATGQTHSVRQFLKIAFQYVGIKDWQNYIKINPKFFRPCEVQCLRGDASKIKSIGWTYNITFQELIHNMIDQEFGKPNKFLIK